MVGEPLRTLARRRRLGGAPARRAARRRDAGHPGVAAHDGLGHRAGRVVRRQADRAGRPACAQGISSLRSDDEPDDDAAVASGRRRPATARRPHSPSAPAGPLRRRERLRRRPHRRRRTLDRAAGAGGCVDGRAGPDGDGVRRRRSGDEPWTLPPVTLLHRAGAQSINRAEVEARGKRPAGVAAAARRRHDARRDDDRSHRHPLRARARSGREGRPGDVAAEGHRLRDGRGRRAHPRSDPGSLGDRRRGPQPHPSARRPRRPAGVARGERAHRPAGGGRSARTSPASRCSSTSPPRRTC